MPRVSEKTKKAMEKAGRDARKEVLKPKRRRRRASQGSAETPKSPSGKFIVDEWGLQGEVFSDGSRYWGVFLEPGGVEPGALNMISRCWSLKEWEERKQPQVEQPSKTTETESPSLSTQEITKSTRSLKKEPIGKSRTKSGNTATPGRQEPWPWTSTSLERKGSP